jgi:hypothetical protein
MSDTNPSVDPPEPAHREEPQAERADSLAGDDVASAPALQPRSSGDGDLMS